VWGVKREGKRGGSALSLFLNHHLHSRAKLFDTSSATSVHIEVFSLKISRTIFFTLNLRAGRYKSYMITLPKGEKKITAQHKTFGNFTGKCQKLPKKQCLLRD